MVDGLIHRNEPLFGRPEDDGFFAPPAVGVGVSERAFLEQPTSLLQQSDDRRVRLKHIGSRKRPGLGGKSAALIDRSINIQSVLQPDLIVILSVSRSGVDTASALLKGNVLPKDNGRRLIEPRMTELPSF